MATAIKPAQSNLDYRDRFFIHQIQKGYAAWIGVLLFLYSALFFMLALRNPFQAYAGAIRQ